MSYSERRDEVSSILGRVVSESVCASDYRAGLITCRRHCSVQREGKNCLFYTCRRHCYVQNK
jgi:hypothetical protein